MSDTLLPAIALACLATLLVVLAVKAVIAFDRWLDKRFPPAEPEPSTDPIARAERDLADRAHFPSFTSPWSH